MGGKKHMKQALPPVLTIFSLQYSPEFALRSYTYLLVHGAPAYIYKTIFDPNPMLIFYFVRLLLGLGCAVAEVYFYK